MIESIIIIAIVAASVLGVRKLPINKYLAYAMLGIGLCAMPYFYVIKYYYKDHAANTAGAFIVYAAFCSVILLNELKARFNKLSILFDILRYVSLTTAICYLFFYGSKVSCLVVVCFIGLDATRLLKASLFRNKYIYYVFSVALLLGPIGVRIVTRGTHSGLTYVYDTGGAVSFAILEVLLLLWLISIYEYIFVNNETTTIYSCIVSCLLLLWLTPSLIQIPLCGFVFALGYFMKLSAQRGENTLEDKFYATEDYTKKEHIITALVVAGELVIALFVLGPLEIFAGNQAELYFEVSDFMPIMIVVGVISFCVLFVGLFLIKNKVFEGVTWFVFALEICMYVQIMFMNIKLQETNGSNMGWEQLQWFMPINIVIWGGIACVVFRLFATKYRKKIITYGCLYLIVVQLIAVVSMIPSFFSGSGKMSSAFTSDNECVLAKGDNIIFFILDGMARDYMEEVENNNPGVLDKWSDFTEYKNANSDCSNTYPSVTHMITGYKYDEYDQRWRPNAWESERCQKFFDEVHSMNYDFNIYSEETLMIGDYYEVGGLVDNIELEEPILDRKQIGKLLMKASFYRSVPYVLKPYLEVYSYQYDDVVEYESSCPLRNYDYYSMLEERGLSVSESIDNQISIIHIQGSHWPQLNDEFARYSEDATRDEFLRGVIYIIDEYLDGLKKIGKYDDTTIFITADHSMTPLSNPQPIFFVKKKGEHHAERQYSMAPISHGDFQATMLELIGNKDDSFGPSIWDIKENEARTRILEGQFPGWNKNEYYNVEYTGNQDDLKAIFIEKGMAE